MLSFTSMFLKYEVLNRIWKSAGHIKSKVMDICHEGVIWKKSLT